MKIWPYEREVKKVDKVSSWHLGMCYKDKQCIVVGTKGKKLQELNVTTVHELLHAIFHSYGIAMKTKEEEDLVNTISLWLTQILQELQPWINVLELTQTNDRSP